MLTLVALLAAVALIPAGATAAICASYSTQADAQRAGDTRDADGDGRYCESLPCPCAGSGGPGGVAPSPAGAAPRTSCARPVGVQRIVFSRRRYPNIRRHYAVAVRRGWPRVLVINRPAGDARRDRLMDEAGLPTRAGFDRDEYPPAVGRGRRNGAARGLVRGANPVGWMADLAYVRSSENRSQGATLGRRLAGLCDGVRFRYIFR